MKYLILNFKTYPESSGEKALELAAAAYTAQTNTDKDMSIIICPQAADIYCIREKYPHLSIWAQHVDPIEPGRNTGWTSPATIIMAGANGTLVNHSEHKLAEPQIVQTIKMCKQLQMTSCIAVPDLKLAQSIDKNYPDFIAYEPEDLISGGVSLIDTDVAAAKEFVQGMRASGARLILGAGITSSRDIKSAIELGYAGVLLASGFVKAADPHAYLGELLTGFAS